MIIMLPLKWEESNYLINYLRLTCFRWSRCSVTRAHAVCVALPCDFSVVNSLDKPSVDKRFTQIHQDKEEVSTTWPDTRGTVSQTPRAHKRTFPIGPTETLSAGKVRGKQEAAVGEPLVLISF